LAASLTPSRSAHAPREARNRPALHLGKRGQGCLLASQARVVSQTVPASGIRHRMHAAYAAHPLRLPGLLRCSSCLPDCQTSTPIVSPLPDPILGMLSLCHRLQGVHSFFRRFLPPVRKS